MSENLSLDMQKEYNLPQSQVVENPLAYKETLKALPEVQALTSEIDITNGNSILTFGQKPSEGLSQTSDMLLSTMKRVNAEEAAQMLTQLTKIMDKFDIEEIKDPEKQGVFQKILGKAKGKLDSLFAKYDDMGKEVDKIYVILKQYENDIRKSNDDLSVMYKTNIQYYEDLEKYIVAGELGIAEIEKYEQDLRLNPSIPEEQKQMQLQKLSLSKDMLAQRVYDLQIAENVAMQTTPMIHSMQLSNFNLMRKINSSFVITLPIFKQCLIQAMQLKRQEIQAKSIQQLDAKTNELLIRNAQNTATQSVKIAQMAGGSSIQIETLQNTYQTIKNGIEETRRINEEMSTKRKQDSLALEHLKDDFKNNIKLPGSLD